MTFPGSLLADGSSSSTVTVTLKDKSGSPMVGKSIVLVSDRGSLDTVTTSSGPSDPNGKVVFKVRSTHAGVSVYSATDVSDHAFVSASANVTFLAGSYIPSQSALVAAQPSVPADGNFYDVYHSDSHGCSRKPCSGKSSFSDIQPWRKRSDCASQWIHKF